MTNLQSKQGISKISNLNIFKQIVEQSPNSVIITDLEGNIEYVNPRFIELTGYSEEELINKNTKIFNAGTQPPEYYSEMWETIKKGKTWHGEFHNKKKNGEFYWEKVKISPLINENKKITHFLAIKEDITRRKETIKIIERERLFNDKLIETSPAIFFLYEFTNDNAKLIKWNKNHEEQLGYTSEDLQNMIVTDFYQEEQLSVIKDELEKLKQGKKIDIELDIKHKNGHTIPYYCRATGFKVNKKLFFIGIGLDISKHKENELKLVKAKEKAEESNRLKTEFINNMSHEIRTPMNAILGFSGFLSEPNLTDKETKNYVKIIQNSGNQLLRIIDDILEISRLGTKQVKVIKKEICLNDLLLEHFSIFDIKAKENNISLYLNKGLSDTESVIYTDNTKLNKILSNLLENALKFTHEGFIEFGYQLRNNELEIYVKDTGIGINKENQEVIFERFSQEEKDLSRSFGGLGLGLSIAKENAELIGGRITLNSKKGKGSTFSVVIPYSQRANKYNINEKTIKKQSKHTILIVEDEEVNFLYLDILLKKLKYKLTVLHVKNGKEAVEICKNNKEIEFVLMDIKMPIMNGLEATKQIKEFRPELPIIAQTAYSTNDEKRQALNAGCNDFISKPIDKETLIGVVDKYLIMK